MTLLIGATPRMFGSFGVEGLEFQVNGSGATESHGNSYGHLNVSSIGPYTRPLTIP